MSEADQPAEGYEFPCEIPVTVIGEDRDDFEGLVVEVILTHIHPAQLRGIERKNSSAGKYLSVTITFEAESRAQLNAIFAALGKEERVRMVI